MGSSKSMHLALLGTESLRGKELRKVLETAELPPHDMELYDPGVESEYSNLSRYRGEAKAIHSPDEVFIAAADLLFLAAEGEVSLRYGRLAEEKGVPALDLNLTFNRDPHIPLVVAGVNDHVLREKKSSLIANPHPATVLFSHLLQELNSFRLKKVVAFLLQPVSAYGQEGIDELAGQTLELLDGASLSKKVFRSQIAFNCLSQTEPVDKDGFSETEKQIVEEVRRIFQDGEYPLTLSLLQVPVFFTYTVMIYLELGKNPSVQTLKNAFKDSAYVEAYSPSLDCPASAVAAAGSEKIIVSQIKKDRTMENGYWLWGAGDNLTRGSALNAVEIARVILEMKTR
jgi:aspartate-semialdehyde dehydrogenase